MKVSCPTYKFRRSRNCPSSSCCHPRPRLVSAGNIEPHSHKYSNYAVFLCVNLTICVCTHFADQLYPFGDVVGDAAVPSGIVEQSDTISPPLTLSPTFRFFGMDEDTIYVG